MKFFVALLLLYLMSYSNAGAVSIVNEDGQVIKYEAGPGPIISERPKIPLPPGVYINNNISGAPDEALPDDLKQVNITTNTPVVGSAPNENLPDDMKGILSGNTGAVTGTSGDVSSSNTATSAEPVVTEFSAQDTESYNNTSSGKVLWFILFSLLILLVITVIYVISNRKNIDSSPKENLILK